VVSGNVSLYNETADSAIMPTPTVGTVGLLRDVRRHATMRWRAGDAVLLLGPRIVTIGGSEYLALIHGVTGGAPPTLDLAPEREVQRLVREAISDGRLRTAHDCADGGLAIALAEMAMASGIGFTLDPGASVPEGHRRDAWWFGEGASRILAAGTPEEMEALAGRCGAAGIDVLRLGRATGDALDFGLAAPVPLASATARHAAALLPSPRA
ncbi:MAG: AIR synthase-related protein, partial [Thermomicrobiales bacterium]